MGRVGGGGGVRTCLNISLACRPSAFLAFTAFSSLLQILSPANINTILSHSHTSPNIPLCPPSPPALLPLASTLLPLASTVLPLASTLLYFLSPPHYFISPTLPSFPFIILLTCYTPLQHSPPLSPHTPLPRFLPKDNPSTQPSFPSLFLLPLLNIPTKALPHIPPPPT